MKESQIILKFQQLENKQTKLAELVEQNFRQVYMVQGALSVTLDAIAGILIDKGIVTQDDLKAYVKKETDKRMNSSNEVKKTEITNQPVMDVDAGGLPTADGEV